jgi:O-methyltransferase
MSEADEYGLESASEEARRRRRSMLVSLVYKFVGFCSTNKFVRPLWSVLEFAVFYGASLRGIEINFVQTEARKKAYDFISLLRGQVNLLGLANNECYQIYSVAQNARKIDGSFAEVGVYRGGSARIICEVKGDRPLFLFDTFEGLPETSDVDTTFEKGQYDASYQGVKELMAPFPNVVIKKGFFPESADVIENETFAFVNLDVDTYRSTLGCLEYFYPRMNKGGAILSHDYSTAAGVNQAFGEFFADKPELIIEVAGSQCLVIRA